jgi:hypothetical protein
MSKWRVLVFAVLTDGKVKRSMIPVETDVCAWDCCTLRPTPDEFKNSGFTQ